MGVVHYTCAKCQDTYPDCGPNIRCENSHGLCGNCMPEAMEEDEDGNRPDENADGELLASHCPVCQAGGTELEKLQAQATG